VQTLARRLGIGEKFSFVFGGMVRSEGAKGARAALVLYAGANHFRHIDEWSDDAGDWGNPKDADQARRHAMQRRSMEIVADTLGEPLPIRSNLSYELVEVLFGPERHYRTFEDHLLRIGQDAMKAAGMAEPIIGLTVTETRIISDPAELAALQDGTYVVMSGVSRAAD
jgi:hypothetical protein